jgi:hypothetical protein
MPGSGNAELIVTRRFPDVIEEGRKAWKTQLVLLPRAVGRATIKTTPHILNTFEVGRIYQKSEKIFGDRLGLKRNAARRNGISADSLTEMLVLRPAQLSNARQSSRSFFKFAADFASM